MVPRIRGQIGQIADGPDVDKWVYQITLWDLAGEKQHGEPIIIGPYGSEAEAQAAGKKAIRLVSEKIERMFGDGPSGKYIDLKNGAILRPWEEQ